MEQACSRVAPTSGYIAGVIIGMELHFWGKEAACGQGWLLRAGSGLSDFIAPEEDEAEEGPTAALSSASGHSAERGAVSGGADEQPSGGDPPSGKQISAGAKRPRGASNKKHKRASPELDDLDVAEVVVPSATKRLRKAGSAAAATPSGGVGQALKEEAGPSSTVRRKRARARKAQRDPRERILAHQVLFAARTTLSVS